MKLYKKIVVLLTCLFTLSLTSCSDLTITKKKIDYSNEVTKQTFTTKFKEIDKQLDEYIKKIGEEDFILKMETEITTLEKQTLDTGKIVEGDIVVKSTGEISFDKDSEVFKANSKSITKTEYKQQQETAVLNEDFVFQKTGNKWYRIDLLSDFYEPELAVINEMQNVLYSTFGTVITTMSIVSNESKLYVDENTVTLVVEEQTGEEDKPSSKAKSVMQLQSEEDSLTLIGEGSITSYEYEGESKKETTVTTYTYCEYVSTNTNYKALDLNDYINKN